MQEASIGMTHVWRNGGRVCTAMYGICLQAVHTHHLHDMSGDAMITKSTFLSQNTSLSSNTSTTLFSRPMPCQHKQHSSDTCVK